MTAADSSEPAASTNAQRLDKWLFFARLVKTRTLAAALISSGKTRVNRMRVDKPSHPVRPGDVVTALINRRPRVLRILACGERRGPASEAQRLYEELTPAPDATKPLARPEDDRGSALTPQRVGQRAAGAGRPTKRDRRTIDRLRGGGDHR